MLSRYLRDLWQKPIIPLLLTIVGAGGSIGFVAVNARRTYDDLAVASAQRQNAYDFLVALRLLRQHTGEARVGLTGYVLTHDSAYEATYANGIAGFKTDTAALRRLAQGRPTLDRTVDRLRPALMAYEGSLAGTMARSETESIAALQRDLKDSRDFVLLDSMRLIFVALETDEKRLLEVDAADVSAAVSRSREIVLFATFLGAGLVLLSGGVLVLQALARDRVSKDLRKHERQLSSIYDAIADGLFQLVVEPDGDLRFISANPAFLNATGLSAAQVLNQRVEDVIPGPSLPRALARFRQAVTAKRIVRWEDISAFPAGTLTCEMSVAPVLNAAGNCEYLVGVIHDSTQRMQAAAALRESEERLREMATHINEAFFIVDIATRQQLYVSPAWARVWGRPIENGYDPDIWFEAIHPDDRAGIRASLAANANGEPTVDVFRIVHPDGTIRWARGRAFPVRDAMGQVYRLTGVTEDITEQREVEERSLEAQKMEAIGLLAGGVAHDFNNLLTVMLGHVDIALGDSKPGDPHDETLREVRDAAVRAAALTRGLLEFSRQTVVAPVVFRPNEVVTAFAGMVKRLIGENIDVVTRLAADAGAVRADRGQFEQTLMNLVVNSRDAMPDGGRLTLETANVTMSRDEAKAHAEVAAGDYVTLAISDSGGGMTDAVKARIFEPFYTTKSQGKGTGLGLATSYGTVQQAGGYLTVRSEVGAGSTFCIYLPRVDPS